MSRLTSALGHSVRVDTTMFSPVIGLVTALPVVALFGLGISLSNTTTAIALAVGANLVAVVSLIGAPRISLALASADAVGMGVSTFIGMASATNLAWHLVLLVLWCFGAGLLVAFGQTQAAIGSQAIIAFVVFGRFTGSLEHAAHLGLLVSLGALGEVLALMVLRLPPSLRHQRLQVARATSAVAQLARARPETPAIAALNVLDAAGVDLERPALLARADALVLQSILNQLRRARLELTTLAGLHQRVHDEVASEMISRVGQIVAAQLDTVATRLGRKSPPGVDLTAPDLTGIAESLEAYGGEEGIMLSECARHVRDLDGQVRAMLGLAAGADLEEARRAWSAPHRSSSAERSWVNARGVLRGALSTMSPPLRHAIRLSLAVPLAVLLASWWHLPRGYWLAFAVTVILKPDYSSLLRLGVSRLVGTLLGAGLAALLVSLLHPGSAGVALLVGLCAWVAYSTWSASFSVSIGFVTALILILLSTALREPVITALDRLLDVSLGGLIAVGTYLVWPTPPRAGVVAAEGALFSRLADYFVAVSALLNAEDVDPTEVLETSRAARMAWARAELAVGRSLLEPRSSRIPPEQGQAILAASMRILRALHALRAQAEHGVVGAMSPALASLEAGVASSLRDLGHLLEPRMSARDLRGLHREAANALSLAGSPASLAVHLDELVNAINTAHHAREEITTRLAKSDF